MLPLLHYYQQPEKPLNGALASTERFRGAVQERVWEKREKVRGASEGEFLAWVRRIASSLGAKQWGEQRHSPKLLGELAELIPSAEQPSPEQLEQHRN